METLITVATVLTFNGSVIRFVIYIFRGQWWDSFVGHMWFVHNKQMRMHEQVRIKDFVERGPDCEVKSCQHSKASYLWRGPGPA